MHLLRLLPGSLPGRRDRRGTEFRVRDGNARGALLRQGAALGEWGSLGAGDRQESGARRAVSVRGTVVGLSGSDRRVANDQATAKGAQREIDAVELGRVIRIEQTPDL